MDYETLAMDLLNHKIDQEGDQGLKEVLEGMGYSNESVRDIFLHLYTEQEVKVLLDK